MVASASHIARILVVGDELLAGRTRDGNGAWLAGQLDAQGIDVRGLAIVGDAADAVAHGVAVARQDATVIVVTGGLGPTDDDGTRAGLALASGAPLEEDEYALRLVRDAQASRGFELDARRRREAQLPRGAVAIPNPTGTAPGVSMMLEGGVRLFALPGVPRECRAMFVSGVLPRLVDAARPPPASRAFRVAGVREPDAAEQVAALGIEPRVAVAFYPHEGELELRFTCRGEGAAAAAERACSAARACFGGAAYDDAPIQAVVVRALAEARFDVTTAESLTGGLIARMLVEVEGASDVFRGGWVTYSDTWKRDALGVDGQLLKAVGPVSSEVAAAMADGARRRAGVSHGVAATGIAGPADGHRPSGDCLPAGTFFVAVAGPDGAPVVEHHRVPLERLSVQRRAAVAALDLLRRRLGESEERRSHD